MKVTVSVPVLVWIDNTFEVEKDYSEDAEAVDDMIAQAINRTRVFARLQLPVSHYELNPDWIPEIDIEEQD